MKRSNRRLIAGNVEPIVTVKVKEVDIAEVREVQQCRKQQHSREFGIQKPRGTLEKSDMLVCSISGALVEAEDCHAVIPPFGKRIGQAVDNYRNSARFPAWLRQVGVEQADMHEADAALTVDVA